MAPAPGSYRESHLGAAKARSYDEDLWDPQAAKGLDWLVEQRLLAGILRSAGSSAPGSAADFACGTGRVLEFLGRYFPAPVGIDVSPDMLALARARCPRAKLILGDVTTMPSLAPGPFDLITAFRFFLNAEPPLRSEVLAWMRAVAAARGACRGEFPSQPRQPARNVPPGPDEPGRESTHDGDSGRPEVVRGQWIHRPPDPRIQLSALPARRPEPLGTCG